VSKGCNHDTDFVKTLTQVKVGHAVGTFVLVEESHGCLLRLLQWNDRDQISHSANEADLVQLMCSHTTAMRQVRGFRSGGRRSITLDNKILRRIETSLGCRPSDEWISRQPQPEQNLMSFRAIQRRS